MGDPLVRHLSGGLITLYPDTADRKHPLALILSYLQCAVKQHKRMKYEAICTPTLSTAHLRSSIWKTHPSAILNMDLLTKKIGATEPKTG